LNANPSLTNTEVRQIIKDTAIDLGSLGVDEKYGYGLVDAQAAVGSTVPPTPDFSISTDPSSLTLRVTESGTSTITATSLNGYEGTISLSATVPDGSELTTTLNLTSVTLTSPTPSATSLLTITSGSATGTFDVTVTGTDGSVTHSTVVTVKVTSTAQPTAYLKIDMSRDETTRGPWPWSRATATVTVQDTDASGPPIIDATVYGHWSDASASEVIGTTNGEGKVTFRTDWVKQAGTFTFTVDRVEKDGATSILEGEISDSA
jgi:hypothetical protein